MSEKHFFFLHLCIYDIQGSRDQFTASEKRALYARTKEKTEYFSQVIKEKKITMLFSKHLPKIYWAHIDIYDFFFY